VRPVFADAELERSFTERGYVVVDALPAETVAELLEVHAASPDGDGPGFSYSMQLGAVDEKARIADALRSAYERHIGPMLIDFAVMAAGFAVKAAEGQSAIPGHLDWSMVDETRHRSLTGWIALTETNAANGALAVVPGSQRLPFTIRGSRTAAPIAAQPDVVSEHLEVVPMSAGQVILYEPRVIHGSATNASGRPRVAAGLGLLPAELTPLHYVGQERAPGQQLREVEVDRDFFFACAIDPSLGHDPLIDELVAGRPSRVVSSTRAITAEDLGALRANGRRGSGKRRLFGRRSR
jgi:hypothetical protein